MLSKMMKNQPSNIVTNGNTKDGENRKSKTISSSRGKIAGEEKRRKVTHALGSGAAQRIPSVTNWDKFKDLVTELSGSVDKKTKSQTQGTRPFRRPRRDVERNFSTIALVEPSNTEAKENGGMEQKDSKKLTKQIAMDCEMVGIGDGTESMLARVSLVNRHGDCLYDRYVKPRERVKDYRTAVSGIRPHHLNNGDDFETVQREVAEILKGRILVGHALKNDMNVLFLSHPKRNVRDTSRYKPFRKVSKGGTPSLKKLATELLGIDIQSGEHNSVEDARTAMQLYVLYKTQWEMDIRTKR